MLNLMGGKSVSGYLTFILVLLVFSGPVVNANRGVKTTDESEYFVFSSDICLEMANESNIDLDSILFGGENFEGEFSPTQIYQSNFIIIESEKQFLDLLLISGNIIVSGSKLYFPNDIRIDLSDKYGIVIEENVTLLGSRGILGQIGTIFFTTNFADPSDYVSQKPLFSIIGNNVIVSSLVFEGPAPVGGDGDFDWKEGRYGLEVNHHSDIRESYVEIINNEFYGFGHASVSIEKTFTLDIRDSKVLIESNFIHDNMQFQSGISGTGYGIVINNAYPLIRSNEFGLNRHDVAHTGYFHNNNSNYLAGYEFAYNLLHLGATDHLVDVHCYGKENSTNCEDYAGDFVYIHNNLFYDTQVAIAIRGAPTIGVCIHDNEFVVSESQFLERKNSSESFGNVFAFGNLFNQENNIYWADADEDGIGDRSDSDDDNDEVPDHFDAFPLNSSESVDTDLDGIGNNADLDDDNDGIRDSFDQFPLNESKWKNTIEENFTYLKNEPKGFDILQYSIVIFLVFFVIIIILLAVRTQRTPTHEPIYFDENLSEK